MRYTIRAAVGGRGVLTHVIKAKTQDEALARFRRAYNHARVTPVTVGTLPDLEEPRHD